MIYLLGLSDIIDLIFASQILTNIMELVDYCCQLFLSFATNAIPVDVDGRREMYQDIYGPRVTFPFKILLWGRTYFAFTSSMGYQLPFHILAGWV